MTSQRNDREDSGNHTQPITSYDTHISATTTAKLPPNSTASRLAHRAPVVTSNVPVTIPPSCKTTHARRSTQQNDKKRQHNVHFGRLMKWLYIVHVNNLLVCTYNMHIPVQMFMCACVRKMNLHVCFFSSIMLSTRSSKQTLRKLVTATKREKCSSSRETSCTQQQVRLLCVCCSVLQLPLVYTNLFLIRWSHSP